MDMTPSKPDAARDPVAALLAAALYREHDYTVDKGAARSALNRLAEQGYVLVNAEGLAMAIHAAECDCDYWPGENQKLYRERATSILAAIQEQGR